MKGFSDQRSQGHVMSTDSGMDLEEELFPLVGRDVLHEYSRWTSLVKFVTKYVWFINPGSPGDRLLRQGSAQENSM